MIDDSTDPIGGVVNAPAGIAGHAAGGEVLVSDVVRQLVGHAPSVVSSIGVANVSRGSIIAGISWPATDASTGGPDHGTIGRVDEFARLQDFVSSLVAGSRGTVALEGEAGIGKTHLVREVSRIARSAGAQVVEVVADEVTRRAGFVPYGLIDDGRIPVEQPRPASRAAPSPDPSRRPGDLSFAIVESSVDAVESLAATGAVLLIVEDAHWADDLSLSVMWSLIVRARSARFGVVVSVRPAPRTALLDRVIDSVVDSGGGHLRLGTLDDVDLHALSAAITGAAPGQQLRERLRATGGNPLFVSELLRSFDEEGMLRIESGVAEVPASVTPSNLNETLVRRLSWLAIETRELLRLASLLGTSFTLADLATVTGRSVIDVAAWLRDASLAGLVTGDGDRLVFRHDLVHDAVYDDMLPAERRDLHRAAGHALARTGAPTQQVARQFARGAVDGDLDAVDWLVRAADETVSIAPSAADRALRRSAGPRSGLWDGRTAVQARMIEPIAWCGQFERAERIAAAGARRRPDS